ncbi:hypothetical protein LCGC14_2061490, partial [marine sediment metagenome]
MQLLWSGTIDVLFGTSGIAIDVVFGIMCLLLISCVVRIAVRVFLTHCGSL